MKVSRPGKSDLIGINKVYWMQTESFSAGGRSTRTLTAWLDPVKLGRSGRDEPSLIDGTNLKFANARMEPSIAERGSRVELLAHLNMPTGQSLPCVVVARNNRTHEIWEMHLQGDGEYSVILQLDKHFPRDDQVISIIAYPARLNKPGRRGDVESAIDKAGLWDVKKYYIYNPLLVVSRERADVVLTVLEPERRK